MNQNDIPILPPLHGIHIAPTALDAIRANARRHEVIDLIPEVLGVIGLLVSAGVAEGEASALGCPDGDALVGGAPDDGGGRGVPFTEQEFDAVVDGALRGFWVVGLAAGGGGVGFQGRQGGCEAVDGEEDDGCCVFCYGMLELLGLGRFGIAGVCGGMRDS